MSDINIAIRAGDIDEVVRYIENGGDITKDFNYCIRAAAEKGYVNIVKLLLENGADCNEGSYSATTNACMRGHIDTLNILLEHGGDIFKDDNSSIKLASYYGYFDMVKLLLKLGVDCTTENNAAIRNAHTNNHSNVVELLSEYGARLPKERNRGFELVSKYENEFVFTMNEFNKEFDEQKQRDGTEAVKRLFIMPSRGTKQSACYDIFNNSGEDIILEPGELSGAITTYVKAYMLDDEVLMAYVRSGHGFKYSVRLANSTGIIDSDYYGNTKNEGEMYVKLHNQGDKRLRIPVGEAMSQFMFQKYLITDNDEETVGGEREGGFGSTSGK